ncbi:MFS family permease [Streptomyces griseochromogenes]|uniref:MFS family permease n=1 Tax=Streptomyces griseochromogenes TaxID=68214 RepID=A0ABS4LK78_9ACTN|nr:MFS transporter [Streptomyces griseochromogenes]MBP2047799.1 MFS family permease [Streptomyces griseochromogenes]
MSAYTRTPAPQQPQAQGAVVSTLAIPAFRRYLLGQLTSNVGTWMQRAAQDLLVLHLTGNNGSAVGMVTALQFLPQTLFSLTGGVLADRCSKRRLLLVTHTGMAVQSLLLGLFTVTGAVSLPMVYILAFALGTATAVDSPARSAFVSELVTRDRVATAVSLNSTQFNVARILGPAAAGLTAAAVGVGPVFLINTVSYLAVLYGLLTPVGGLQGPAPSKHGGTRVRDAFRHIASTPELRLPITLIAFVSTFGFNFQVTTSLMAITVFHSDSAAFGCLSAGYAVGSLVGAILGARIKRPPTGRRLVTATVAFGLLEATLGLMPGYDTFLALLIPTGYAAVTITMTANSLIQLHAEPHLRGRVLSAYFLVLLGGTPVGAPLVGLVSDAYGARWTLLLGGLVSTLAAVTCSTLTFRLQRQGPPGCTGAQAGERLIDTPDFRPRR